MGGSGRAHAAHAGKYTPCPMIGDSCCVCSLHTSLVKQRTITVQITFESASSGAASLAWEDEFKYTQCSCESVSRVIGFIMYIPLTLVSPELLNYNFYPLEVVCRYSDTQLQVGENYSHKTFMMISN